MSCPFYGKSLIPVRPMKDRLGSTGPDWELIEFPHSSSNRCALIVSAHAPCQMNLRGLTVDWAACVMNPEVNGIYRSPVRTAAISKDSQ